VLFSDILFRSRASQTALARSDIHMMAMAAYKLMPPSTISVWPVTYAARDEAKNATAFATSSASP
jgi:hypothetical protein